MSVRGSSDRDQGRLETWAHMTSAGWFMGNKQVSVTRKSSPESKDKRSGNLDTLFKWLRITFHY